MRRKEMAIAIEKLRVRLAMQAQTTEEARFRSAKAVQTVYNYEARFAAIEAALNIPEPRWGSQTIHPADDDATEEQVTDSVTSSELYPGNTIHVDTIMVHMTREDAEWWSVWPHGRDAIQMEFYDRIKLSTAAALGDKDANL